MAPHTITPKFLLPASAALVSADPRDLSSKERNSSIWGHNYSTELKVENASFWLLCKSTSKARELLVD